MPLTSQQLSAIKADILANPDLLAKPAGPDGAQAVADLYNAPAVPDYYVWRTRMSTDEVFDMVVWANMTPNDLPDGTQLWLNRNAECQSKQLNLQTMLVGRDTLNPSKANIRAGLQDALTNVPSGNSGANRNAGWTALQLVMSRKATRLEKLLASGAGTKPAPSAMTLEGAIGYTDIEQARVAT